MHVPAPVIRGDAPEAMAVDDNNAGVGVPIVQPEPEVIVILDDSDEDLHDPEASDVPEVNWREWAGAELSVGEIMFNRDMLYSVSAGKLLYNNWRSSVDYSEWRQHIMFT